VARLLNWRYSMRNGVAVSQITLPIQNDVAHPIAARQYLFSPDDATLEVAWVLSCTDGEQRIGTESHKAATSTTIAMTAISWTLASLSAAVLLCVSVLTWPSL
jgi:hypothetical protein